MRVKNRKVHGADRVDTIAIGFFLVIMLGTLFLLLPISTKSRTASSFSTALFTAASATCVTGLVVADTSMTWSLFGQLVILALIQIGGLGIITLRVFVVSFMNRKIGLYQRNLIQESVNSESLAGGVRLIRKIVGRTLILEGAGMLLMAPVFVKDFGWKGLYYAFFHSISAFCNAGFDVLGNVTPGGSLTYYKGNWYILGIIMILIISGGLGFIVWEDLSVKKLKIKEYSLQTRVVLVTSGILIVGGACLLFLTDYRYLRGMPLNDRILIPLFQSVTCRTAGFNTIPIGELSDAGRLVMVVLMFIGGSPGSTAGGIKTTTFLILCMYIISVIRNDKDTTFMNRRFDEETIRKAFSVFLIDFILLLTGVFLILLSQHSLEVEDVIFEAASAIGTVGLTTGITPILNRFSRLVIVMLMYGGRLGSLTFAFVLNRKRDHAVTRRPAERIAIG